jgi:transposase
MDNLARAVESYRSAVRSQERAAERLREAVNEERAVGGYSQSAIAAELGWSRQRLYAFMKAGKD